MSGYKMLLFYTEQRWSDGNDSQATTEMPRKGRRRSDVSEDIVDENAGTWCLICFFTENFLDSVTHENY